jgi:hypothetical protein
LRTNRFQDVSLAISKVVAIFSGKFVPSRHVRGEATEGTLRMGPEAIETGEESVHFAARGEEWRDMPKVVGIYGR